MDNTNRFRKVQTVTIFVAMMAWVQGDSYYEYKTGQRFQQAIEGKSCTLRCLALERAMKYMDYENIEKMEWRKDGYIVAYYSNVPTKTELWVSDGDYFLDRSRFSLVIDNLTPAATGQYKCWPRFRDLPQGMHEPHWHNDVIFLSVLGVPDVPERPVVLSYASRIALLSWTRSSTHADAPVTQYIVRTLRRNSNDSEMAIDEVSPGNGTSSLVSRLWPVSTYRFQVAAENIVGRSQFSDASYPIRTRGEAPIAPPKILSVYNTSNTSLIITWTYPASSIHGSRLVGYRLSAKPVQLTHQHHQYHIHHLKSDISTFEMVDLIPYTKYMITLEADNVFGLSPPATVFVITAEGVPADGPKVTKLRIVTGSEVEITFSCPLITRGILTHYTLYYQMVNTTMGNRTKATDKSGNVSNVKIKAASLYEQPSIFHYRLRGLKACTNYSIWLTASTSRGESAPSNFHYFITDSFAPSDPVISNVSAVELYSVTIEWLPPRRFCLKIDFYLVTLFDGQSHRRQYNTSERNVILRNLSPLKRYTITTRASTRSFLISDRPRYYVGPESSTVQLMFIPSLGTELSGPIVSLRTSFCPPGVQGGRKLEINNHDVFYCDDNLPGTEMPSPNHTVTGNDNQAESQASSTSRSGVSVVAVAVLGTFGLLILLLLFVVMLVHFWRRHFGGKDCLTYAADALDSNLRGNHSDAEAGDDTDCESVAMDDFVEYVKSMHADSDSGFARQFEKVERICSSSDFIQKLSYEHSVMPENKMKNRYVNILAYDHSRVRLRPVSGVKNSDYINANFVDGFRQRRAFIATQGPLPNTIADFWRMVWEQKCTVIVMITNIIERGRKKCEQYWPSEGEETYGGFAVSLISERITAFYTDDASRTIVQYHCTCWADHGVPENTSAILKFIEKSKLANVDPAAPIIVHCSAGVGRSGTYIVIDAILREMRVTNRLNIYGFLKHIRRQRMCLVQTEDQFIFCYDAIAEAVLLGDTEISVHDFRRVVPEWLSEPDSDSSVLRKQFEHITRQATPVCSEAQKPFNSRKNRDGALLPADDHRVVLSAIPGEAGSDYINATFMPGYHRPDEFIVTQFPIEDTIIHFWRMIWDYNCRLIVFLSDATSTNLQPFWPQSSDSWINAGLFSVTKSQSTIPDEDWPCVELILGSNRDNTQWSCQVIHVNWTLIRDQFNEIWRLISTAQKKQSSHDDVPLVVVDSSGGCASATFCLLNSLNCQLDEECCVDVYTLGRCYQQRRPGVIPTLADYSHLFACLNSRITTSSDSNGNLRQAKFSAATLSKSLPSVNGYCHNPPLDTTL